MPTNAKAKREARARKARTGESYATARMNTFEEEVVDVPTQEQLWERFTKELDDHPVASGWEFFGLRSHWSAPKHRQHLYKLLIRRKGSNRDWWWFEDDISVMPPDFPYGYRNTPDDMKPSGDLSGVLAFAAETGTPNGFTPEAVDRAISEVRARMEPRAKPSARHTGTKGRVHDIIVGLVALVEMSDGEGEAIRKGLGIGPSVGPSDMKALLASPCPHQDYLKNALRALDDETCLKVLAVMYCGRDNDRDVKAAFYDLLPKFVRADYAVSQMMGKKYLAGHLRDGLALAGKAGVDLDERWPAVSEAAMADTSGADLEALALYGGLDARRDADLARRLDEVARAARRVNREAMIGLGLKLREDYGEEKLQLAYMVADLEGYKAKDGGYVLAAVSDAFAELMPRQKPTPVNPVPADGNVGPS